MILISPLRLHGRWVLHSLGTFTIVIVYIRRLRSRSLFTSVRCWYSISFRFTLQSYVVGPTFTFVCTLRSRCCWFVRLLICYGTVVVVRCSLHSIRWCSCCRCSFRYHSVFDLSGIDFTAFVTHLIRSTFTTISRSFRSWCPTLFVLGHNLVLVDFDVSLFTLVTFVTIVVRSLLGGVVHLFHLHLFIPLIDLLQISVDLHIHSIHFDLTSFPVYW